MKRFRMMFLAKERGALGTLSRYCVEVEAESEDQAWLKLYDTFDHVTYRHCKEVEDGADTV